MQSQDNFPTYTSAVLSGPICAILDVDWMDVVAHAGIAVADRDDRALLVTSDDYLRLWAAIIDQSEQDDIPRLLGLRLASGPAVPVLFAMSTAPDFETGIRRMAQFKSLFGPMQFILSSDTSEFNVRVAPDRPGTSLPGSFSSPQIIYLHAQANALAQHTLRPLKVSLPLPMDERERLADIFGFVPDEGEATLTYKIGDTRIPFISDNPELWDATEADLNSQAMIQSKGVPISERVRATMLEAFSITEPTISHVCARLQLSRSTLLRRLNDEEKSYQSLLDETRKDLAIRYLVKSELNNQQIAHLVGYRDPNSYQRAFKKWTGLTPREFRSQALEG